MARQQSAAQLFGQLGQGIGQLGSSLGKTGIAQAALGEAAQAGLQKDINALLNLGGLEQQQAQTELSAARQTEIERQMEPFQRIGFLSDTLRGVPSTQSTLTQTQTPPPSLVSQLGGIGLGITGLANSGLLQFLLGERK